MCETDKDGERQTRHTGTRETERRVFCDTSLSLLSVMHKYIHTERERERYIEKHTLTPAT